VFVGPGIEKIEASAVSTVGVPSRAARSAVRRGVWCVVAISRCRQPPPPFPLLADARSQKLKPYATTKRYDSRAAPPAAVRPRAAQEERSQDGRRARPSRPTTPPRRLQRQASSWSSAASGGALSCAVPRAGVEEEKTRAVAEQAQAKA
jgi:hypothetical protein